MYLLGVPDLDRWVNMVTAKLLEFEKEGIMKDDDWTMEAFKKSKHRGTQLYRCCKNKGLNEA